MSSAVNSFFKEYLERDDLKDNFNQENIGAQSQNLNDGIDQVVEDRQLEEHRSTLESWDNGDYLRFFGLACHFRDSYKKNWTNVCNWFKVALYLESIQAAKNAAFRRGLELDAVTQFVKFSISNKISHQVLKVILQCVAQGLVRVDRKELLKGLGREPSTVAIFESALLEMIQNGDSDMATLITSNTQATVQKNVKVRQVCKKISQLM
eukprot:TRINITY_DN655_c0_g1_i1.p1 TRINITY_DN655_c0_g1~~TRINITY_DN655_c0_g1_i1.p1  ORF type:complete len:235 (-),score=45.13 TRINITY_DN655_c0_g1_i1:48-671(-)